MSAAADPLIPLITTVPAGRREDALAYVRRQHERLTSGVGYSFAIADAGTDEAVGQFGLWTGDQRHGRAGIGYWIAPGRRRRGYVTAALHAVCRWAFTLPGIVRLELRVEPGRTMAIRSATCSGRPLCRHHCLRSSSDGICLPYSIRLALLECQPANRARSRCVSPADVRISRRQPPSACLACCSGDTTGKDRAVNSFSRSCSPRVVWLRTRPPRSLTGTTQRPSDRRSSPGQPSRRHR